MAERFAELASHRLVDGLITHAYHGAWKADVVLDGEHELAAGPLTLTAGTLRLVGAVLRSSPYQGRTSASIVGGRGGWRETIGPKPYKLASGVKLSLVVGDAAREVGELVRVDTDAALGDFWVRMRGPAQRTLGLATSSARLGWYVDADGTTVIGTRASSPITSPFELVSVDAARGACVVASEALGDWTPGRTFTSPRWAGTHVVGAVTHSIGSGKIRTEVLVA